MLLQKIREKEMRGCEKKRLSLGLVIWYLWIAIWNSERSLLPLGFGSAVWWFALSWCVATFGFDLWLSLWFVCNSYLVFVNLCFVFVRESYLGVFEIWVCESTFTLILLSQICYSEICSSSPVDVGYCRTT